MTEREALLRAVCENPDDDTPRLVFADWLQENGEEERAEFIRFQIELRRPPQDEREREALISRGAELFAANEAAWRAELPAEPGWEWGMFNRGFVEELTLWSEATPVSDPALAFATAPLVHLTFMETAIGPWIPHLRRIRELTLGDCPLTDAEAIALCAPDLGLRLRLILIIGSQQFGPAAFDTLVARFGRDAIEHF